MEAKVYLGIGHGGSDPGAVANGLEEADVNLAVGLACRDELERHDVLVLLSRTKDESDTVSAKVAECNAFNPALAADIHFNAGGGDGAEVYHHVGGGTGKTLAANIAAEIAAIGQNLRYGDSGKKDGLKTKKNSSGQDYYGFIRSTYCPAVITEGAFLDNKNDVQIIDTPAEQKAMGIAIAKGFLKTLNIAYIAPAAAAPEASTVLYRVQVGAFSQLPNAERLRNELQAKGYKDAFIVAGKK